MSTFVLVHGAWHGGWCWQRVVRKLQAEHTVYAPTLTGVGDRSHLNSPSVDMDTHVADIVNLILWEDLTDVVLVGHSYGGLVVTRVADAIAERLRSIVYLDAFVPSDGDTELGLVGVPLDPADRPAPPAAFFGVHGEDGEWIEALMTPMPGGPSNQPIRLEHEGELKLERTYVQAEGWDSMDHFRENYARACSEPGWKAVSIAGSHDLMIDRPDEVVEILLDAAR